MNFLEAQFNIYKQTNPNELTSRELTKLFQELSGKKKATLSDQLADFMLWCRSEPSRQTSFANLISNKLSTHPGAKILEVGCGRTAIVSRILSQKGFQMTCIDPQLDLSSVKGYANITGISGKFDYRKFDITAFDFVIALEPCEATEHVVRACIAVDKPFFMALCGAPHKLINGTTPKTYEDWHNYLFNIAPDKLKLFQRNLDTLFITKILKSKNF